MSSSDQGIPLAPGEEEVVCPYDASHRVTNVKLLHHIQKCQKNYVKSADEQDQEIRFEACRYNFTHRIPRPDLEEHEKFCQDQFSHSNFLAFQGTQTFEELKDQRQVQMKRSSESLKMFQSQSPEAEADWVEEDAGTYNPTTRLMSKPTLYFPTNLTRAQKKKVRQENRETFSKMLKTQNEGTGTVFETRAPELPVRLIPQVVPAELPSENMSDTSSEVTLASETSGLLSLPRTPTSGSGDHRRYGDRYGHGFHWAYHKSRTSGSLPSASGPGDFWGPSYKTPK